MVEEIFREDFKQNIGLKPQKYVVSPTLIEKLHSDYTVHGFASNFFEKKDVGVGKNICLVSGETWHAIRNFFTEKNVYSDVATVAVLLLIENPSFESIQENGAYACRNHHIGAGLFRSILNPLINVQNAIASVAKISKEKDPLIPGDNREVKILASHEDKILDVLCELFGCSLDLQGFMGKYKIIGWGGVALHPLLRFKMVPNGGILKILEAPENFEKNQRAEKSTSVTACGLRNQGNTCFMNSGLQCLVNCQKLSKYFLEESHKRTSAVARKRVVAVVEAYAGLVLQMIGGDKDKCVITPKEMKDCIGRIYNEYDRNDEQDVVEFITRMLDVLHEGLNEAEPSLGNSTVGWWDLNKSIITDLFFFKLKSKLLCKNCGKTSTSLDPAMCLSLPIPRQTEYRRDVFLFYATPRAPTGVCVDLSFDIATLKKFLQTKHGVGGEIVCVKYRSNQDMVELTDHVPLASVSCMIFCYEYFKKPLGSYYWLHMKTRKLFSDKSFGFNMLVFVLQSNELGVYAVVRDALDILMPRRGLTAISPEDLSLYLKLDISFGARKRSNIIDSPIIVATNGARGKKKLFDANIDPLKTIEVLSVPIVNLRTCLDTFLESEDLHSSESLCCDGCGKRAGFVKKMDFEDHPEYLIVQFKRFQYVGDVPVKINTKIEYQLDNFVLDEDRYRVIGICNHDSDGSTSSGHYTSYLRKDNSWYLCDDQNVVKVENMDKGCTYALFLEKIT